MDDLYPIIADMIRRGEDAALATVIRAERSVPRHMGSKMLVRADGGTAGSVGGGGLEARCIAVAAEVIASGECRRMSFDLTGADGVCGGEVEVFLEPLLTRTPLVVVGMGHVGRALLDLSRHLPFRFLAVDDRPEFLEGLGAVETLCLPAGEIDGRLAITPRTVVLLCTRSHEHDADALAALFRLETAVATSCAFVGLVGSRSKARHIAQRFVGDPHDSARFEQVAVPVGLDICAETPHEIALSILAEVLAATRGGGAAQTGRLRDRPGRT